MVGLEVKGSLNKLGKNNLKTERKKLIDIIPIAIRNENETHDRIIKH